MIRNVLYFSLFVIFSSVSFLPAIQPISVVTYNLEPNQQIDLSNPSAVRHSWDETEIASALQGIVNRKSPRLYLYFVFQNGESIDRYWFSLFSQPSSDGQKGWLQDADIYEAESLEELLRIFRNDYKGAVIYDERVPATSNLASTVAGVENLLPIRFDPAPDSFYSRLVTNSDGPQIPVKLRLLADDGSPLFTGKGKIPGTDLESTGSAKVDAYKWLIENYIKTGKTSSSKAGYYMDAWWLDHPHAVQNHLLTNRDYFIAARAPFVDLSPWNDEAPNDDLGQKIGTDTSVLTELLGEMIRQNGGSKIIHVGGFVPWDTKYTDAGGVGGKHGAVDAEWKLSEILSNFNACLDADALGCGAMANASFYAHFPLKKKYSFPKPDLKSLKKKGLIGKDGKPADKSYITIYVGDYDSAAWVYQMMPRIWNDPNRGSIPITWAFNPSLADRFAPGFDYFRKTATPNDFFAAGDSGAGYINPMGLVPPRPWSNLPSGTDLWVSRCLKYYRQWDITVTGFLIDGFSPATDEQMRREYARFSPDGIVLHHFGETGLTDGMPWIGMKYDLPNTPDAEEGAKIILNDVQTEGCQFLVYRTILWTPTQLKLLYEKIKADPAKGDRIEVVDLYSFFLLMKKEYQE